MDQVLRQGIAAPAIPGNEVVCVHICMHVHMYVACMRAWGLRGPPTHPACAWAAPMALVGEPGRRAPPMEPNVGTCTQDGRPRLAQRRAKLRTVAAARSVPVPAAKGPAPAPWGLPAKLGMALIRPLALASTWAAARAPQARAAGTGGQRQPILQPMCVCPLSHPPATRPTGTTKAPSTGQRAAGWGVGGGGCSCGGGRGLCAVRRAALRATGCVSLYPCACTAGAACLRM